MSSYARTIGTIVMLAVCLGTGESNAQLPNPGDITRSMANSRIMMGNAYLDSGRYTDAAAEFETVVLDFDDPDHEISDLRATAGVLLCLARARAKQMDAARKACTRVIQMPDAPQETKKQASTLLSKLN